MRWRTLSRYLLTGTITAVALIAIAVPAPAAAPGVATRPPRSITETSALLRGIIDADGDATSYYFEYGPTAAYGTQTPTADAGSGVGGRSVAAKVDGLSPGTVYHVRLVATNSSGTKQGLDRTFQTVPQVTLAASPVTARFGGDSVVQGQLKGTNIAGRRVGLERQPFPFKADFHATGTPTTTDQQGRFELGIANLLENTHVRIVILETPVIASRPITVGVGVRVGIAATPRTVRRGGRVRFSGNITPAHTSVPFSIQKWTGGAWSSVGQGLTTKATARHSQYQKTITVDGGGRYRVRVQVRDGDHRTGVSRAVSIRTG